MKSAATKRTTRTPTTSCDRARLWEDYRRSRDVRSRNALAEAYLHVVGHAAYLIMRRMPHGVRIEDLESFGFTGLLDAIRRFDPGRGVKFETFCVGRVRGAMLDGLRAEDVAPRLARSRANRLERAYAAIERRNGRPATDAEVARELGLTRDGLEGLRLEVGRILSPGSPVPRRMLEKEPFRPTDMAFVEDRRPERTPDAVARRDLVRMCLGRLPARSRFIMRLYYFEDLDLEEIGLALDLSESMVCQLHAKALSRIRAGRDEWAA